MEQLQQAISLLASARRLVVFTGAGVSADSGIPTFRGSGSGAESFWGQYDPMQLATPQGFRANPRLVYDWYSWRRSQLREVRPNPAHEAIARWQAHKRATIITQNIDGLHERIAPPGAPILRLHGTLAEDRCSTCDHREKIDFSSLPSLRPCPRCSALLRPDVVWFGEPLDPAVWAAAETAIARADLMLVVGTSGEVWPAAGLVATAADHADVIVVNLEPSSLDGLATVSLHGRAADILPRLQPC